MTSKQSEPTINTEELFSKFKSYFYQKFENLNSNIAADNEVKALKNCFEAKELTSQGNSAHNSISAVDSN